MMIVGWSVLLLLLPCGMLGYHWWRGRLAITHLVAPPEGEQG